MSDDIETSNRVYMTDEQFVSYSREQRRHHAMMEHHSRRQADGAALAHEAAAKMAERSLDPKEKRDWFAGQALQAIIAKMPEARFAGDPASYEKAAMAAFYYADAMLAARKGGDA